MQIKNKRQYCYQQIFYKNKTILEISTKLNLTEERIRQLLKLHIQKTIQTQNKVYLLVGTKQLGKSST